MVSHWPKSVGIGSVLGKNHGFGRFRFSASAVKSRCRCIIGYLNLSKLTYLSRYRMDLYDQF